MKDSNKKKYNWKEWEKFIRGERDLHNENVNEANNFEENVFSVLYDDTKVDPELRELFHRLNYQRVVDELTASIKKWKKWLFAIAIGVVSILYVWSTYGDQIIPYDQHSGVLEDYEQMMSAIDLEVNWQKHGHAHYPDVENGKVDSTFVELAIDSISPREDASVESLNYATKAFWNVYFIRYILLRVFISVVLIMFIASGIRIYKRLRRDRMSLIYKEEATTTMIYFIQKYMVSEVEGKKVMKPRDRDRIVHLLPLIARELYHNPEEKYQSHEADEPLVHRMMEMMENIVGNAFSSGSNGKNGTRTTG